MKNPLDNADRFPAVSDGASVAVCRTPREARIRVGVIFHGREFSAVLTVDKALQLARRITELAGEALDDVARRKT
jgi:ABC-type Na+ transport system ATPase subunit NatA